MKAELKWFMEYCEEGEDVAAIGLDGMIHSLSDILAIIGYDGPKQPEGTTTRMLAEKILRQVARS